MLPSRQSLREDLKAAPRFEEWAAAVRCPWCRMGAWESNVCMQKVKGFMFDISIFIFSFMFNYKLCHCLNT